MGCQSNQPIETTNQTTPNITHQIKTLSLVALTDAGWTEQEVQHWSANLPQRFGECGIRIAEIDIETISTKNPLALADTHPSKGPLIIFTDKTGTDHMGRASGGVTYLKKDTRPFSLIARHSPSGRKNKPEQVVIHELAHQLGLSHAAPRTNNGKQNIDLMHPRGCLYCGFKSHQCTKMRNHKLVTPIATVP